jgi:hypothetical protein
MINLGVIMEMSRTCIKLMIFVPVDGRVYVKFIREIFVNSRKVYRQFIVNYTVN